MKAFYRRFVKTEPAARSFEKRDFTLFKLRRLVAQGHIPGLVGNTDYGVNQSSAGYLYFYFVPEFTFQQ